MVAQEVVTRHLALLVEHDLRDLRVRQVAEIVKAPPGIHVRHGFDIENEQVHGCRARLCRRSPRPPRGTYFAFQPPPDW
jgi:hypothetical protein